jgi:cell division ATPase FtsA
MLDKLSDGVVLCGGGALIPHIEELARSYFSIPVRIGQPSNVSGEEKAIRSPRCVTPIGLLHLGYQLQKMEESKAVPLGEAMKRDMRKLVNLAKKAIKF